ncbi:hypothetical protein AB0J74_32160 [Asanoa sp. NPDC049573]|uniref:hypothetical protein n=1 Tax=Asanoa sp. NPDC049573 TaxID=3155396 RepID=UPI0034422BE2
MVLAAGAWLGEALASDGFRWTPSKLRLQRNVDGLKHQVHVQPRPYNRTGECVEVGTILNVRDRALARWRQANPDRVISGGDAVCGHQLGYAAGRSDGRLYGDVSDGDIDLTDPAQREQRLQRFVSMFREAILPWFAEASEPGLIVGSRAGDHTNDPTSVVEWLASRDRPDLIAAYAQRYLSRIADADESYAKGVAMARSGQSSPSTTNQATALGWSVTRLTET